jgi:glycosyltransferase involved in cell wall biosynthesis
MEVAAREDVFSFFWHRICSEGLEDVIVPIRGRSDLAAEALKKHLFDLVFIDGDHRYENVLRDIQAYAPLVRSNGILCGHDCEGRISDFGIAFLESGKEVDVHQSVHCGVVLAVGFTFSEYSVNNCIWSVRASKEGGGWEPTNLEFPLPVILANYQGFNLIRYRDLFYALPQALGHIDFTDKEQLRHPEIISSRTLEDVRKLIDEVIKLSVGVPKFPEPTGSYKSYDLVKLEDCIYALPQSLGSIDFTDEQQRSRPEILKAKTQQEIEDLVSQAILSEYAPSRVGHYKDYNLVRYGRRVYAVPQNFEPVDFTDEKQLGRPGILTGLTQNETEELIDEADPAGYIQEPLDDYKGYNLVRYRGRVFAVPQTLGEVNLADEELRTRPEILFSRTREEVEKLIQHQLQSFAVEYAGWLPVFAQFGNCGRHPQFGHLNHPPLGYRFVCSSNRNRGTWLELLSKLVLLIASISKLCVASLANGAKLRHVLSFLVTRGLSSQLLLPKKVDLLFLPSVPFTYGQHPWIIEIEDTTSFFFPFLHNGQTESARVADSPYFPIFKALVEAENCRGIVTHVRSTADAVPVLFGNAKLSEKVTYVSLGVKVSPERRRGEKHHEQVRFLFTNSWHQDPQSFYIRGGLDLIEAFASLRKKYSNISLTLRTKLPVSLDARFLRIMENCDVRVIDSFLDKREWQGLLNESDIYVLPAARIHAVSVLEAMGNGLAVVVSDGWGMEEYVEHGRNGIVVKGRYGKCSWIDAETGMLKENYKPLFEVDSPYVESLVDALSGLIDDGGLRKRLGKTAQADVHQKFNVDNWNSGLHKAFSKALARA